MVTLRPDHPHPITSARPVRETGGVLSFLKSLATSPERGSYRVDVGYIPYRSAHKDIKRSGVIRFLPTWRRRVGPPRFLLRPDSALGVAVPTLAPESQPPEPAPTDRATTRESGVRTPAVAAPPLIPDATLPAADTAIIPESSGNGSLAASSNRYGNPFRPLPAPSSRRRSGVLYELERSRLLPPAHPSEGSSLAAVLGFGEKEASFAGVRPERGVPSPVAEQVSDPWQDLPSLSTVTSKFERPSNTGDAVRLLWEATAEMDVDTDLLANEVSPVEIEFRSRRRIRWSMVLSIAVLVALMAVTAKVVTDLPARQAQETAGQFAASTEGLLSSLGPLEQTLAEGGLLSDSGLSTLTDHLYTLESVARAAATLASQELPRQWILGSGEAVEELALPRQLLESAAGNALEITQRVGYAMTYSLALSEVLGLPDLPEEASRGEADTIANELSLSIAETQLTLSGLPDDILFQPYLEEASQIMSSLEAGQADYIAALRTGDSTGASRAGQSMVTAVEDLRSGLHAPLENTRTWALTEIHGIQETVGQIESLIVV
ncbi:MAG: hypothetical protein OXF41_19590 [bacterium]|nr:hypothetical protein [bacterium]